MSVSLLLPLFCILSGTLNFSEYKIYTGADESIPPFMYADAVWVDSVLNSLSLEEKIAQLLMYPAYSNQGKNHESYVKKLISEYKIGGLIFMQGTPERQAELVNQYQELSEIPLLIAMDAEWSLSMRLQNTVLYPRQMMLGAIQDNSLLYDMGEEFARQLKRVGVHVNFAPVVDVNNNPNNPVINCRSFGEDIDNVAQKAYNYMKGMQNNRILATGKHFPGHGDTEIDSHYYLPSINHDRERLDSIELFPFKYLIERGLGAIMSAHLCVPAIDNVKNTPSSLSEKAINGLLKSELGFRGLIFTDALNMGGITNHFNPGDSDFLALIAGNDILLFPNDPKTVIKKIAEGVHQGAISEDDINYKCRKVLMAKYWAGLYEKPDRIELDNLVSDLNNEKAVFLNHKLTENAITLVKNDNDLIPLRFENRGKIASLSFGINDVSVFQKKMDYYISAGHFVYNKDVIRLGRKGLKDSLELYDVVIVSIHNTNRSPSANFGIPQRTVNFISELAENVDIVLNVFGNPYSIDFFNNPENIEAIIVSYNDRELTNEIAAQVVFGGIPARGRLPVSPNEKFPAGTGIDTEKTRLKYSDFPYEAGVDAKSLKKIDSLLLEGLKEKAYPGARVMAARNGIVFYDKSFGYHTCENNNSVQCFDIYDLASLTKVLATTAAIMKLYENGDIDIEDKIADYLPKLKNTDKNNITFKEILVHQAGLRSWIPFYLETIAEDSLFNLIYSPVKNEIFNVQVAANMFIMNAYVDTLYSRILESRLNNNRRYVYSDVGFYFLKDAIEEISGMTIDEFVYKNFYDPVGAWSLKYNPVNYFDKDIIVPTEIDTTFRRQLLHGFVHDHGAAMQGGVAGHAGLFGNANDVLKFMQVFLNMGEYGGKKYFEPSTIERFTRYNNRNVSRRGLGFDKPDPNNNNNNRMGGKYASDAAYGHLGFTGTMLWVDPEYDLVVVFLSNRIYPNSENRKLITMNIRNEVLTALYKAIMNYEEQIGLHSSK